MKQYIEITLSQNEEINFSDLWSKLFTQIHLGFVSIQDDQEKSPIGISFPEYFMDKKFGILGSKLRLFAQSESDLLIFDTKKHLSRLSDYVHISGIREVPQKINGYSTYSRYQPKVNKERLARRRAIRHKVDYDAALEHYSSMNHKTITMPYINLKSLSNKNEFCLWIKKTSTTEPSNKKIYSTYGLSLSSTVPEF